MRIVIKSLKEISYEICVPSDNSTVMELKQIIENSFKFDKNSVKILFNGSVLENSLSLFDYGIKEDNVLIMMNLKPKVISKIVEEVKDVKNTETKKKSIESFSYPIETKVLVEMGFSIEQAQLSLEASKGDINLAIEFIEKGLSDNNKELIGEKEEEHEEEHEEELEEEHEEEHDEDDQQEETPIKVLENIASIVKFLSKNDPNEIQNVLISLNQHHPEMIDLITENEAEFNKLVSKPVNDEDIRAYKRFQGEDLNNETENSKEENKEDIKNVEDDDNENNEKKTNIKLSEEDYDAVQRLKSFGFSEEDSVEAYFAFDKNDNLAANFLYESKNKETDDFYIDCKSFIK